MNTYTTFEVNDNLKIEWHGGSTFNVFREIDSEWHEWDVFSIMHIDNLADAKEFVSNWALDITEDYLTWPQ